VSQRSKPFAELLGIVAIASQRANKGTRRSAFHARTSCCSRTESAAENDRGAASTSRRRSVRARLEFEDATYPDAEFAAWGRSSSTRHPSHSNRPLHPGTGRRPSHPPSDRHECGDLRSDGPTLVGVDNVDGGHFPVRQRRSDLGA